MSSFFILFCSQSGSSTNSSWWQRDYSGELKSLPPSVHEPGTSVWRKPITQPQLPVPRYLIDSTEKGEGDRATMSSSVIIFFLPSQRFFSYVCTTSSSFVGSWWYGQVRVECVPRVREEGLFFFLGSKCFRTPRGKKSRDFLSDFDYSSTKDAIFFPWFLGSGTAILWFPWREGGKVTN